jgi:hypothetical protein
LSPEPTPPSTCGEKYHNLDISITPLLSQRLQKTLPHHGEEEVNPYHNLRTTNTYDVLSSSERHADFFGPIFIDHCFNMPPLPRGIY